MNKKVAIASVLVVILLFLGVYFLFLRGGDDTSSTSVDTAENENVGQVDEKVGDDNDAPNPLPDPKNPPVKTPPSETRTVTITRAYVTEGNLVVAAIVEDAKISDNCTLVMQKMGQNDQKFTNPVVQQSSYISCKNFVVETASLPSAGEWLIQILINEGTGAGESDVQTVTI